ncbi:hypothetical protein [Streptomyces justiciae]|uniref:hypothetical protein n=1 Tax=Streptomyces justiciae TaxID=2780140 RepID=UPI00211856B4|nr:hypothetical protein [Streptomyces justiciae]MCW8383094.1 hypothetical protein [Streptomyces justiciae]
MPLPHFELSSSQYRLLAETLLSPLPDVTAAEGAQLDWLTRGLDPGDPDLDVSELAVLGLIVRRDGVVSTTPLGAAVHHRAAQQAVEERLSAVVRLVETVSGTRPGLTRAVRGLSQGSLSFEQALHEAGEHG